MFKVHERSTQISSLCHRPAIFDESSTYFLQNMLIEYSTGLEISKFEFFGKLLNLKLCQDRLIDEFSLDVNSFQDTLKITSKSGIFDESSEYFVKNMLVEYSTGIKIETRFF